MRPITPFLALILAALPAAAGSAAQNGTGNPVVFSSARVALEGTSNIHAYTASTTAVRLTAVEIQGVPPGDLLDYLLQPGAVGVLEITIPAATLTSPRDGIDKNMHKALKVQEHPDIRFRLRALEPAGAGYRGLGSLTIAGVEKEVALNLQVERRGAALAVNGSTELLMTDYGIAPPKAMLGMLRTNPRVQIRLDLMLAANPAH
jgi:hypothetical protein